MNTAATNHPGVAASNVATSRSSASNVSPTEVPHKTSSSPAPASNAAATENYAATHQNTSDPSPVTQSVSNNAVDCGDAISQSFGLADPRDAREFRGLLRRVSEASRNNNTVLTASRTQPAIDILHAATSGPVSSHGSNLASDTAPHRAKREAHAAPRQPLARRPNMRPASIAPNYSRSAGPGGPQIWRLSMRSRRFTG